MKTTHKPLTPRETEVAQLITEGLSNKLIADRLGLSEHTAKFHVNNVCKKFGTTTRVGVAVAFTMAQIIKPCVSCGHYMEDA